MCWSRGCARIRLRTAGAPRGQETGASVALIRKIGVIGQGHVGAHVANSLLMQGVADELYLADINAQKLESEC